MGNLNFELVKNWFQLKENRNKLKSSASNITYIIPARNARPERVGSAMKRIKTNKRSTLKPKT